MSTEKTEKKTETPKAADPFAGFDPMTMWAASQHGFHKLVADAMQRAQSFAEQYATLEAQMVNRAQGAVATWAQLTQDAIAYGAQLSADARKLSLDAARKYSAGA